ncbi:MAG: hypothetical protein WCX82_00430 [archaeon]
MNVNLKILLTVIISSIILVTLVFFKVSSNLGMIIVIVGNIIFYILEALLKKYLVNQKKKKFEIALIDEVLLLSSQPRSNDLKQMIQKLSSSKHKIVEQEFKIIQRKIEDGHNIRELFEVLSNKYKSEIIDRFLELLYNSITTGTVTVGDYRSFASNFMRSKQLIEERASALLMQKYTIIFAGGFIVPGILGIVISLVKKLISNLDFSAISQFQGTVTGGSQLFGVCYFCSIIYIIEYVIISSIYLSMLESDLKKTIIYLVFMLPVAIAIFFSGSLFI